MLKETLEKLAETNANVMLATTHDCEETGGTGEWGWSCSITGPRVCHKGMENDQDADHDFNISVFDLDPERALERTAAAYRAAYSASTMYEYEEKI